MKKLNTLPIKDVALGIYDGPHATPPEASDGPVFLGIKNVTANGRLDFSEIRHVSEEQYPKWTRRVTPQENDIVFSYEATLHRYAIIPPDFRGCLGRRMALIRPDPRKVLARFLHFYLLAPEWRSVVESNVISGATVDRIPIKRFPTFPVRLPSLVHQAKVVEVLSAYDDQIGNNRRRMQLLEQSARLLYQEWFVRLRFPGHEHVKITDGVPEGWARKTLADVAEAINYGYTASADIEAIGPKFLRITDIVPDVIDWNAVPHCPISDQDLAKFQLREGDIVIARTGATVGYAKWIGGLEQPTVFASYLVRIRFSSEFDDMLGGVFIESPAYKAYVRNICGGAAQPNANAKVLAGATTLIPPIRTQRDFRELVEPLFKERDVLQKQNQILAQARDILLPRLMNGEVVV